MLSVAPDAPAGGEASRGRRSVTVLLVLLILASLTLTLWYASYGLHAGRYWDERFSLANVRALLSGDSLRPANGYYQTLSYLPQTLVLGTSQAVARWSGAGWLAPLTPNGGFTPTGYFLCRMLQTIYGAGVLLMTFLVGRRLFSPQIGLLGAFLLAVTPWHVQASSNFKPDIVVTLTVLVAFHWSLRAVERATPGRFALAGVGVALAVSSKLTGAVVAVPLLLAVVLAGGERGRGARLLAAAGAGGGAFVALNPYFPMYTEYFTRNLEHYASKAEGYGGTRIEILVRELELITGWSVHGKLVGGVALVAAVALAAGLLHEARRAEGGLRGGVGGWMLLSFPLAYSLAYGAATSHFKGNNFVVIFPFTALLAAWGLAMLWRLAASRLPALGRRRWLVPAVALLVVTLSPRPFLYAYRGVVPSTEALARAFLIRQLEAHGGVEGRRVYTEAWPPEVPRSRVGPSLSALEERGATVVPVPRLPELTAAQLAAGDGEIFPAARLEEGAEGVEFYLKRLAATHPSRVCRVSARPFEARGPARVALALPGRGAGPPGAVEPGGRRGCRGR